MYTACKHRGFVVISYYDLRAASLASHTLQGQLLKGHALEVHFSLPKDEKESRQVRAGQIGMLWGRAEWAVLWLHGRTAPSFPSLPCPGHLSCCSSQSRFARL